MKFALTQIIPPGAEPQEYILGEDRVAEYAVEAVKTGSQFSAIAIDALDAVIYEPQLLRNKEIFLEAAGILWDEIMYAERLAEAAGLTDEEIESEDEPMMDCEGCPCFIDGQCVPEEYQEPAFAPIMNGEDLARARADYPFFA